MLYISKYLNSKHIAVEQNNLKALADVSFLATAFQISCGLRSEEK